MTITVRDHLTLAIHQYFGDNIPAKTANRFAAFIMNTESVENIKGDILKMLRQKAETSHNRSLPQVTAALAYVTAKRTEHELSLMFAQGERIIKNAEEAMDNYLPKTYEIAARIENSLQGRSLLDKIALKLMEIHGLEMDDPHHFAVALNDLRSELNKTFGELSIAENNRNQIAYMKSATWEDHDQMVAWDLLGDKLQLKLEKLENKIPPAIARAENAHFAKAMTVIDVAKEHMNKLPPNCQALINEHAHIEEVVMGAPELIAQTKERMKEIKRQLDEASAFADRTEGTHFALQKATSPQEAESIMNYANLVNARARVMDSAFPETTEL